MAKMPEKNSDNRKQKIVDYWKELYQIDHESFTPLEILEQVTILLGVLTFLVGFWYVLYRLVQALI